MGNVLKTEPFVMEDAESALVQRFWFDSAWWHAKIASTVCERETCIGKISKVWCEQTYKKMKGDKCARLLSEMIKIYTLLGQRIKFDLNLMSFLVSLYDRCFKNRLACKRSTPNSVTVQTEISCGRIVPLLFT